MTSIALSDTLALPMPGGLLAGGAMILLASVASDVEEQGGERGKTNCG